MTNTTSERAQPARNKEARGGFRFAGATFLAIGVTSTAAQYVAAATLGITEYFEWGYSTGGLIALVGGTVMGFQCRNWAFWRKWIWLWVGITVLVAFVAVNTTAVSQSLVPEVGVSETVDEQPAVEETAPLVTQECFDMYAELETTARLIEEAKTAPEGDWRRFLYENGGGEEYAEKQAEYAASC